VADGSLLSDDRLIARGHQGSVANDRLRDVTNRRVSRRRARRCSFGSLSLDRFDDSHRRLHRSTEMLADIDRFPFGAFGDDRSRGQNRCPGRRSKGSERWSRLERTLLRIVGNSATKTHRKLDSWAKRWRHLAHRNSRWGGKARLYRRRDHGLSRLITYWRRGASDF